MTVAVLSAITAASFLVWTLPQESVITVSDHGAYLERIRQINLAVTDGVEDRFANLVSGQSEPAAYVDFAEFSSAQLRSELIQMVKTSSPEQWHKSYQKQADSTKLSITYVRETIAAAEKIGKGADASETVLEAQKLLELARGAALEAQSVRPDA